MAHMVGLFVPDDMSAVAQDRPQRSRPTSATSRRCRSGEQEVKGLDGGMKDG